eukprot:11291203-Alexandrium_andersonii.AAC.1
MFSFGWKGNVGPGLWRLMGFSWERGRWQRRHGPSLSTLVPVAAPLFGIAKARRRLTDKQCVSLVVSDASTTGADQYRTNALR